MSTATPSAKGEDANSSDDESSGDEEDQTVSYITMFCLIKLIGIKSFFKLAV